MVYAPFEQFRAEVERLLSEAISAAYPEAKVELDLEIPPPGKGHLAFKTFKLARELGERPDAIASKIASKIPELGPRLVSRVEAVGGYVNFFVNFDELAKLIDEALSRLQDKYGYNPAKAPVRVLVEYLSANPVHPIHVGGARNALLGESIARLLEWRGHQVRRHYYVNDVGRQVAVAAYGYSLLGEPEPWTKPDHAIGFIYAATSMLLELRKLKAELDELRKQGKDEEYRLKLRSLDSLMQDIARLREQHPEIFDRLADAFNARPDPESEIAYLMRAYERREPSAVRLIRRLCELALSGFKQTLDRVGIRFDSFDWESEITVWSGLTAEVLRKLTATRYVTYAKGVLVFLADDVVRDNPELRKVFDIPENYEVPPLTLVRSDGTTLYTTRDIAYTLWKFKHADRVINVIGMEQRVAQLQLKLALVAMGFENLARNLVHYGYELVKLPGMKMSGRRGRYVTFDELIDEAVQRARLEVERRSPGLPEELKNSIAEQVGIGAIKYALLSVSPTKPVLFDWAKVLNFERNSGPFVQYAHARAHNVLVKAGGLPAEARPHPGALKDPLEHELLLLIAKFPSVVAEAADRLRPDVIAEFANNLALAFNAFYDKLPVIRAPDEPTRLSRLWLVNAVRVVLRNALWLLGISAPTRM